MREQIQKLLLSASAADLTKGQFVSLYSTPETLNNLQLLQTVNKLNCLQKDFVLTLTTKELRITKL